MEPWWSEPGRKLPPGRTLRLNLDNGPEGHSRRTQFRQRMGSFAAQTGLTIQLADYPPDHRQYHPVERCWGVLENHWNGSLLASVSPVLRFAASMTWEGQHPVVTPITPAYRTGVKGLQSEMAAVEARIQRLPQLGTWFVTIPGATAA